MHCFCRFTQSSAICARSRCPGDLDVDVNPDPAPVLLSHTSACSTIKYQEVGSPGRWEVNIGKCQYRNSGAKPKVGPGHRPNITSLVM